jgi:rare lipoprotein A
MKNLILTISILVLSGCSSTSGFSFTGQESSKLNTSYHVNASWYQSGRKTANGEKFNPDGMTAAHKKLPFNTKVKVTNPYNGNSIIVRINDRGPFIKGRELDLARGAAKAIGMKDTSKVIMQVLAD